MDDVNTPFLSKLVLLLASLFIALTFMPWLQLLFATILKSGISGFFLWRYLVCAAGMKCSLFVGIHLLHFLMWYN